jgi:hypothetical protein
MEKFLDPSGNNIYTNHREPRCRRLRVNKLVLKVALHSSPLQWRGASSYGKTLSSSCPLSPPAQPCWRSATSSWTSCCRTATTKWRASDGRDLAAAYLLPRAEAALRDELKRLADADKRARQGQSSSSSGSRAL